MSNGFEILPYDKARHGAARKTFQSGSGPLDAYFRDHLSQDLKSKVAACFVATAPDGQVIGIYTLCASGVPVIALPAEIGQRLPRYPFVPVARMGRLAVDHRSQGHGFGGILVADAASRAANSDVASYALVVDAKDATAKAFYEHLGFLALPEQPLVLFLPLAGVP